MHALHRRHFLQVAATSLATSKTVNAQAENDAETSPGFVDAHSHIWTPDINAYPLAKGKTKGDLTPPSFTAEELLDIARPHGVSRVVLIQHQIYYGTDNSYMTDAAERFPGVFRVVGTVDERAPAPDKRMRELQERKVTGFRITPRGRDQDQWLKSNGMAAMWRCGAETRQSMCCLINPQYLRSVDRMGERYPETPVVIDHFARIGIDGTVSNDDLEQLCRLARHEHVHVKVSAFYALGKREPPYEDLRPMIRRLYDVFGPHRLMWGSDCPYQLEKGNSYAASVDLIRNRLDFLSDGDRDWLMRRTADKVFFAGKA